MRFWLIGFLTLLAAPLAQASPGIEARDQLLRLEPVRGQPVRKADLEGRVVMVVFFASWCPPCRVEFPYLNTVHADHRDAGLTIVAVNVFEYFSGRPRTKPLSAFLDEMAPTFPILAGDRAIRATYDDLDRIPTLFVFDRDGRLVEHFVHERGATKTHLTEAEIRAFVEPHL